MKLERYLSRIGFTGKLNPDITTLAALMTAHLQSVPFENLDQQLGIPVSTDVASAFSKIVGRRRGGWCFELNGLFRWALTEIGFQVHALAAHVQADGSSLRSPADHMVLLVECAEGSMLVDVGFGGSMIKPMPMSKGEVSQPPYVLAISEQDDGYWRFSECTAGSQPTWFDFRLTPVGETYFNDVSQQLQTDESSSFRRTLKAQRRDSETHTILRGCVKTTIGPHGTSSQVLGSAAELLDCLGHDFQLDVPEIATIWPVIEQRHQDLFG